LSQKKGSNPDDVEYGTAEVAGWGTTSYRLVDAKTF